jgi:hypothetical protein
LYYKVTQRFHNVAMGVFIEVCVFTYPTYGDALGYNHLF